MGVELCSVELLESVATGLSAAVPVMGIFFVFWFVGWLERKTKSVAAETEKTFAALDELWPMLDADTMTNMMTQKPEAYARMTRHIAERVLTKSAQQRMGK